MDDWTQHELNLAAVDALVACILLLATTVRAWRYFRAPGRAARQRLWSMAVWWIGALLVTLSVVGGRAAAAGVFALLSVLAMREFFPLAGLAHARMHLIVTVRAVVLLNYLWIALGWRNVFVVFVPVAGLLAVIAASMFSGLPHKFLRTTARGHLGLLLTAYLPGHAPLLLCLPPSGNPVAGPAGWFVYLILLTELNDIAQAVIGRKFGKRRLAPVLSPGKTWEGFFGGFAATALLASLLAPWLTPFTVDAPRHVPQSGLPWWLIVPPVAGMMIAVSGLTGDLIVSAVKREAGVKDSGDMLPTQGGILDRVDSLTVSAPVFFYLVAVFY